MTSIAGLLARPDFLIPIVAAERQFRDHYYGLNSAALLEDLFFDAFGNFLRQTRPLARLVRPPTGQKGWDYELDGLRLSHKVGQSVSAIAALWDATRRDVSSWTFDDPIVYVLGRNNPTTKVRVQIGDLPPFFARSLGDLPKPYEVGGLTVLVVRWPGNGSQPTVEAMVEPRSSSMAEQAIPFREVWSHVAAAVNRGGAANEVEVLVSSRPPKRRLTEALGGLGDLSVDLSVRHRGGVYLFARSLLTDLEVTSNNRAVLVPNRVVERLLESAALSGLFAPLPLWYLAYASDRPPDLFSAQRAEYDSRFSARGQRLD
jgi:hypothetical protein